MLNIRNCATRFKIAGDSNLFFEIVRDMEVFAEDLAPSNHWNQNLNVKDINLLRYDEDLYRENYSSLEKMLDPWVGCVGMTEISESAINKYEKFLRLIDIQGLLPENILEVGSLNKWIQADLGSIMDFNLISAYSRIMDSGTLRSHIVEIGGGYGRLAEVFLDKFLDQIHYVLIDSVPGSLMYSYLYLKQQFPELKIGSYYAGDNYSSKYSCYVMPAWRTDLLSNKTFDGMINIESFQEMRQDQVDHYLALYQRLAKEEALIYLSNARDYIFRGKWNFPNNWQSLFLNNTPRSWSPDHPTHILRVFKGGNDFQFERVALEAAFKSQIKNWDNTLAL